MSIDYDSCDRYETNQALLLNKCSVYKCTKRVTLKECFIVLASAWLTFSNINLKIFFIFIIKVFSSFIVYFLRRKYYRYVHVKKKYIFIYVLT